MHVLPHKDSSRIIKLLGEDDKINAVYATGFGKRKSNQSAIFYPGNHVEIELANSIKSSMLKCKTAYIVSPWQNLQRDILKSSILTFSSECLMVYFKASYTYHGLFNFYLDYLTLLDHEDEVGNFPLFFVIRVSQLLGIKPEAKSGYFNIREGVFESSQHYQYGLNKEESLVLSKLLDSNGAEQFALEINHSIKKRLLKSYLIFIDYHTGNNQAIVSLDVLKVVLN